MVCLSATLMSSSSPDRQVSIELDDINKPQDLELQDIKKVSLFAFTKRSDLLNVILGALCSIISSFGTPIQTIIYGRIFSKLSEFYIYNYSGYDDFIKDVAIYCGMIIVAGAGKLIFTYLMVFFWMRNGENHQRRVRKQIFTKIMVQENIEWVENFKNINGEVSQLNRCIEELRTGNAEVLGLAIQAIVSAIVLFVVAMCFSWSVTLVTLALTPFFALSSFLSGKMAHKFSNLENINSAKSSKIINWCLSHPSIPRLFNGKDHEIIAFKNLINRCSSNNYKVENFLYMNMGLIRTLSLLMFVQAFWFGITMIRLKKESINDVFTSFSACLMLGGAIAGISELVGDIYRAQAAIGKLVKFLTMNDTQDSSTLLKKMSPTWCNGEISFENVDFSYRNKEEKVIRGLNLKIKSNEFNFIVGKSGSGKSTIALLIMGFYKPSYGRVLIDGLDVRLIEKDWICNNISLVQLNPVVFNLSIKENISMAAVGYNDIGGVHSDIVQEACEFAMLSRLLDKIGGLDGKISNFSLSGGEKQRISIARSKLRDTPILIIDEGLSALDHRTKDKLLKNIKEWRTGKTTIFITHQLEQIEQDDFVVIIQDGAVKDQGTKKDLQYHLLFQNNLGLNPTSSEESTLGYDSDDDFDIKADSQRESQIKNYNYLKDPLVLKDTEETVIEGSEHIYSLRAILWYCIKTSNSKIFILVGLIFAAVHAVTNPIFSYLFGRLLNIMLDQSLGIDRSHNLKRLSQIIIGVAVANGVSYYVSQFLLAVSAEKWVNKLTHLSLNKINDQDLGFFADPNHQPSKLNSLLMNDTRDLRTMVSKFLTVSISLSVLVILGLIFALVLGWKLAFVGLAFAILVIFVSIAYSIILQKKETNYKNKVNELEAINYELVNGIKTIHSLNLKQCFEAQFDERAEVLRKAGRSRSIQTGLSLAVKEIVISVATGVLMYYGMRLVGMREYAKLQFMQVITLLLMTFTGAGSLINELPEITRGQRCGSYIKQLLRLPQSNIETAGQEKPVIPVKNSIIKFQDVSFSYDSRKQALKNITFCVKEGDIFGILGESGSGKSTIVNLITRLYGNYKGTISLNNTDITKVNPEFLREYISIVPQNPVFFEGTIYDNLTYGLSKEKMVNTNIETYLDLCNISSFTNSLSEGLQSNIGALTESALVSTGQLQRLAMVRALIRQPKILVLDECTRNLDTYNFNLFKKLILSINQQLGTTILIISHDRELTNTTTSRVNIRHGELIN